MNILLGDFNVKVGSRIFSDRQLGMIDYSRVVKNCVRIVNFAT